MVSTDVFRNVGLFSFFHDFNSKEESSEKHEEDYVYQCLDNDKCGEGFDKDNIQNQQSVEALLRSQIE
jgi:hypothetical protein